MCAGTISGSFHHAYHSGGRLEKRAAEVEVVHYGVKIDLKHCFVLAGLKHFGYQLEAE